MADDNKPLKYMRYAIGEIVLVVIGILIALQINTWNEGRKDRIVETDYLKRTHLELQKDTIYFRDRIQFLKNQVKIYNSFIHNMYKIQETKEDYTKLISGNATENGPSWNSSMLIINDLTFKEITNTGNFDIIRNREMKETILEYYKYYFSCDAHISEMNDTGLAMFIEVYPWIAKYWPNGPFDQNEMFSKEDFEFINDPNSILFKRLETTAQFYSFKSNTSEQYFQNLLIKANHLLELIEETQKD